MTTDGQSHHKGGQHPGSGHPAYQSTAATQHGSIAPGHMPPVVPNPQPGYAHNQAPYSQQPYGYVADAPGPSAGPSGPQPFGQPHSGYGHAQQPPGIGPVVVFTALFGVFGAISASRRAKRAQKIGMPGGRYWMAFAATLIASWVFWGVVFAVANGSSSSSETRITSAWLENSIVKDGGFTSGGKPATVKSATCTEANVRSDGAGTYRCLVDFADGDRTSYEVTVEANGKWVTNSGN